jgi:hypothetical protein
MTEADTPATQAPTSEAAASETPSTSQAQPEKKLMGLPLTVFMRGGGAVPSSAEERRIAEDEADAERRRDLQDKERRIAQIPIEKGGAKMLTRAAADPETTPKVLLLYMTRQGQPRYEFGAPVECLADIILPAAEGMDLSLQIVCPQCKERGIPMGQCQLAIKQSNRAWHLDTRTAGEIIVFDGQPYYSAGKIMDSDRFSCPKCSWTARIHDNKIRPE